MQAAEFSALFNTGVPGTEPLDSAQMNFLFPVTMNMRVVKHNGALFASFLFPVCSEAMFLLLFSPALPKGFILSALELDITHYLKLSGRVLA
jgi:hypothetical protein